MADEPKPRLGRGLAALLGDAAEEMNSGSSAGGGGGGARRAPIERLRPNAQNPRKSFAEDSLEELAQSIRERGVLQPILVREVLGRADHYEIIAGERRWRAAQKAGLHEVPIVKIVATDQQSLEIAIIENVQRADLDALEEAEGYQKLISDFSYTHQDLAKTIGKSRSYVTNALRLLTLPAETRALLARGQISAGHARVLVGISDPDHMAREIVRRGLSVRQIEELKELASGAPILNESFEASAIRPKIRKEPSTVALEKNLSDMLGMKVVVKGKGESGELRIRYETLDQLDLLCAKLA